MAEPRGALPVFVPYDSKLLPGTLLDRRDRFIARVPRALQRRTLFGSEPGSAENATEIA